MNNFIRFVIAYPNTPYIAMSALGWQYIYRELSGRHDVNCEQLFLSSDNELIAQQTRRSINKADIIGFSLQYELDYINLLKILELTNIPFNSKERGDDYPILIAGGPAVSANPEPLADFMDVFVIGEGEVVIHDIADIISHNRDKNKKEILRLMHEAGLYVPLYADGYKKISKVKEYYKIGFSSLFLTEDTEFSNTLLIELTRGCVQACKFCLASYLYNPFRYVPYEYVVEALEANKKSTDKAGLIGASICDYPDLDRLCEYLMVNKWKTSASSLRIDRLKPSVLELLHKSENSMITVAIETGSENSRKKCGKNITDEEILNGVELIGRHGFRKLKIYAISGLPDEEESEVSDLISLVKKMQKTGYQNGINQMILSVNPFVPKKLTPYSNEKMLNSKELKAKQVFLKKELSKIGVVMKGESVNWAAVQGYLAQADRSAGDVLMNVYSNNNSMNSWKKIIDS